MNEPELGAVNKKSNKCEPFAKGNKGESELKINTQSKHSER